VLLHRVEWSDVTVILPSLCCVSTWRTQHVKLSGKDLSRYSNKIESVGLKNVHIITILLRKWCHNNKQFTQLAPRHGGKTAGIDMIKRTYITVTLHTDRQSSNRLMSKEKMTSKAQLRRSTGEFRLWRRYAVYRMPSSLSQKIQHRRNECMTTNSIVLK